MPWDNSTRHVQRCEGAVEERPAPGNARHAHPEDAVARGPSRLGHRAAHPADLERRAAGEPGIALPRPSSARGRRLDRVRVGGIGEQPEGEVLSPHGRGAAPAQGRDRELGPPVRRHREDPRDGLIMQSLFRRLGALVERRRFERELDDEIRFHLEMEIEKNIASGMDPAEARWAAERAFGGVARAKEEVRAHRGLVLVDEIAQDLRAAIRARRRSPGFPLVAMATLALGVGVDTAILSVITEVLLKPVPYADASRVVVLEQRASLQGGELLSLSFSVPELETYRRRSRSFESIVEYHSMPFTLLGEGLPERVDTGVVSAGFF